MDRRTTIKWTLAAGVALGNTWSWGRGDHAASAIAHAPSATGGAQGYGSDPDLMATYHPGQLWPLTLTPQQRRLAGILADIIIPADERSPSASAVGVVDFIDEWVSAPYPAGRRDRAIVRDGLAWLDAEARRRYQSDFAGLSSTDQQAICDEICDESQAAPERRDAAHFFAVYRELTAGGFYSTPVGRNDLGYIGNIPQRSFEGPPQALLEKLGLA